MRRAGIRLTVRRLMLMVAILGLCLGIAEAVRMEIKSARYRRKADGAERMEHRCREIDAMDAATRARESKAAFDDPFLDNPEWTRRLIPHFDGLKRKYRYAAEHPREWVPPDPPPP